MVNLALYVYMVVSLISIFINIHRPRWLNFEMVDSESHCVLLNHALVLLVTRPACSTRVRVCVCVCVCVVVSMTSSWEVRRSVAMTTRGVSENWL